MNEMNEMRPREKSLRFAAPSRVLHFDIMKRFLSYSSHSFAYVVIVIIIEESRAENGKDLSRMTSENLWYNTAALLCPASSRRRLLFRSSYHRTNDVFSYTKKWLFPSFAIFERYLLGAYVNSGWHDGWMWKKWKMQKIVFFFLWMKKKCVKCDSEEESFRFFYHISPLIHFHFHTTLA